MHEEAKANEDQENMTLMQVIKAKHVRWQLISICLMMLCQQLSGKFSLEIISRKILGNPRKSLESTYEKKTNLNI